MPLNQKQIENLACAALDLNPVDRVEFIKEECGDDGAAFAAAMDWLSAYERMKSRDFLDEPLMGGVPTLEGRRIKRYEVGGVLGEGAVGVVYLARDVELERKVALKFLLRGFTPGEDPLPRFRREALASSALNHPNILTVYEIGEYESLHFIATEFVDGETLRERLSRGPLSVKEALRVCTQVADALVAAHRANIIHRDIKPENLMLRPDGYVKVLDFGIAKMAAELTHQLVESGRSLGGLKGGSTSRGAPIGTLQYMSPEQAAAVEVGAQTDLWSLGVVLYETITGRAPFEGENPYDLARAIHSKEPPPLSSFISDAPAELQQIINKALSKDLGVRYASSTDFHSDLQTLSKWLTLSEEGYVPGSRFPGRVTLIAGEPTGDTRSGVDECPYRGLNVFGEEHAEYFKGREAASEELLKAVEKRHFVAYTSASGVGKSSVIFAGLVPRLRLKGNWIVVSMRPLSDPFQSLAVALAPLLEPRLAGVRLDNEIIELIRSLRGSKSQLCSKVNEILRAAGDSKRFLLVIDQFEELYVNCEQQSYQKKFLDTLHYFVEHCRRSKGQSHLLISLRVDFLERSPKSHPLSGVINSSDLRLSPMTREEMREAIVLPTAEAGLELEPGLAERILDDLGEHAGGLPLLEFTLERLWHEREGGKLTHAAYNRLGKVTRALAEYAEELYQGLSEEQQSMMRRVMLSLVAVSSNEETLSPARRIGYRDKMEEQEWTLITQLANARLLTTGQNSITKREMVEVTHEALINTWRRCAGWIEEHRTFLIWRNNLAASLKKYRSHKSDANDLLHGVDLKEAIHWVGEAENPSSPYLLSDEESEFVKLSEQQYRRQKWRARSKQTLLVVGLVGVIIASLVGGSWYSQRSVEALTRNLLAQSLSIRKDHPESLQLSSLLALEAYRRHPSAEAYQLLYEGLALLPRSVSVLKHEKRLSGIAYSPDGQHIATSSFDRTARIWNAGTGEELARIDHGAWVTNLDYSPNGRYIATSSWDFNARILESPSGKEIAKMPHRGQVTSVLFSPDNKYLATTHIGLEPGLQKGRTVHIWEVPSGRKIAEVSHDVSIRARIAFTHDGRYFAFGAIDGAVSIYETSSGNNVITLHVNEPIRDLAISRDGSYLLSGSSSGSATLWAIRREGGEIAEVRRVTQKTHEGEVMAVAFSPDQRRFATASKDLTVRVWDISGELELLRMNHQNPGVENIAFSPDGKYLADDRGTVWEASTGREVARSPRGNSAVGVVFSPDSLHLAIEDKDVEGSVHILELSTPLLEVARIAGGMVHKEYSYSRNGKYLASVDNYNSLSVWEVPSGVMLAKIQVTAGLSDVSITDDGNYIAMSITKFDSTDIRTAEHLQSDVEVWEVSSKRAVFRQPGSSRIKLSPRGHYAVVRGNPTHLQIFDLHKNQELMTVPMSSESSSGESFSNSEHLFAMAESQILKFWDLRTRQEVVRFTAPAQIEEIYFSWDDKYLATRYLNGDVGIWDVNSKSEVRRINHGPTQTLAMNFSPDGQHLAIVFGEGFVGIWKIDSGEEVAQIKSRNNVLNNLCFTPEGYLCIAEDNYIRVQRWAPDALISEACRRLIRNLTLEEWNQYLTLTPRRKTCEHLP